MDTFSIVAVVLLIGGALGPVAGEIGMSGSPLPPPECVDLTPVTVAGDCALWVHRYESPGGLLMYPGEPSLTASRDSSHVYMVSGYAEQEGAPARALTMAINTENGEALWVHKHVVEGAQTHGVKALVAVNGTEVYTIGWIEHQELQAIEYLVIAHDARTGAPLWELRSELGNVSIVESATLSHDGTMMALTGKTGPGSASDYLSLLIDLETRTILWKEVHGNGGSSKDIGRDVAFAPSGEVVFVTGQTQMDNGEWDATTISYSVETGSVQWVAVHSRKNGSSVPNGIAVGPEGKRLYITTENPAFPLTGDGFDIYMATMAYDARTGQDLWEDVYISPHGQLAGGKALSLSSDGSRLFVAGFSGIAPTPLSEAGDVVTDLMDEHASVLLHNIDFVTWAYETGSGEKLWETRIEVQGSGLPSAIAVAPDDTRVYVTGRGQELTHGWPNPDESRVYWTFAIDASTGEDDWSATYGGHGSGWHVPSDIVVTPNGSRVIVTGESPSQNDSMGIAVVAYPEDSFAPIDDPSIYQAEIKAKGDTGTGESVGPAFAVRGDGRCQLVGFRTLPGPRLC